MARTNHTLPTKYSNASEICCTIDHRFLPFWGIFQKGENPHGYYIIETMVPWFHAHKYLFESED